MCGQGDFPYQGKGMFENGRFSKKKILLAGVLMIFSYGLVNNTIGFL